MADKIIYGALSLLLGFLLISCGRDWSSEEWDLQTAEQATKIALSTQGSPTGLIRLSDAKSNADQTGYEARAVFENSKYDNNKGFVYFERLDSLGWVISGFRFFYPETDQPAFTGSSYYLPTRIPFSRMGEIEKNPAAVAWNGLPMYNWSDSLHAACANGKVPLINNTSIDLSWRETVFRQDFSQIRDEVVNRLYDLYVNLPRWNESLSDQENIDTYNTYMKTGIKTLSREFKYRGIMCLDPFDLERLENDISLKNVKVVVGNEVLDSPDDLVVENLVRVHTPISGLFANVIRAAYRGYDRKDNTLLIDRLEGSMFSPLTTPISYSIEPDRAELLRNVDPRSIVIVQVVSGPLIMIVRELATGEDREPQADTLKTMETTDWVITPVIYYYLINLELFGWNDSRHGRIEDRVLRINIDQTYGKNSGVCLAHQLPGITFRFAR